MELINEQGARVYVDYRAADPERVAFSISGFGRKLVRSCA